MAVTLDKTLGTGNSSGSLTTTVTTTNAVVSGGRIVLVAGRFNPGGTGPTMSCAGGSLSWAEDKTLAVANLRISVFSAAAPAGLASSTVLTVTHAGTGAVNSDCLLGATSFLGIDTVSPVVSSNGSNASTAAWSSASVSGNAGNVLVGGAFCDGLAGSSTPDSPAVEAFDFNNATQNETAVCEYILSLSGAAALTGTWSGAVAHITAAVAYKDASATAFIPTRSASALQAVRTAANW